MIFELEDLIKHCYDRAIKLKKAFAITEGKKWNENTIVQEFSVQLGHLTSVYLNENTKYFTEKGRYIESVEDELADVLLQLYCLNNFTGFSPDDLLITIKTLNLTQELKINCRQDYLLVFMTLLGQIAESVLIVTDFRFQRERALEYQSERGFLLNRIALFLYLLLEFSKKNNISLRVAFDDMEENARKFLISYYHKGG